MATMAIAASALAQQIQLSSFGNWKNVGSFSINRTEDYMVFSQLDEQGHEKAYETHAEQNGWSRATPIKPINDVMAEATVGGLYLTDDEKTIYFHATREGSPTGYDIYRITRQGTTWGEPTKVTKICSETDDMYPSVVPGEQGIYFLRHQVVSDEKQERREKEKLSVYYAAKDQKKKDWGHAEPINQAVSYAYVQDARIGYDGVSLYYSIRPEKKKKAQATFSRRSIGDAWLIPENMIGEQGDDYFCPQMSEKNLFAIRGRGKDHYGELMFTGLIDPKYKVKPIVSEKSKTITRDTHKAVNSKVIVKDPTTGKVLGEYSSDPSNGEFKTTNPDKKNYILDVRTPNHSFASYYLAYDGSGRSLLPNEITIFDTIQIDIDLYDSEIFKPINGKVIAISQTDKNIIFRGKKTDEGRYTFRLPIGSNYNIVATAPAMYENKFLFRLEGDIVFDAYRRKLAMSAYKRNLIIDVVDADTKEKLSTEVVINNQSREEKIVKDKNKDAVDLRENDLYSVEILPPVGYAFKSLDIDLKTFKDKQIDIELIPLKLNATLNLKNVNFRTNEALLLSEAYTTLNKLITLLNENPMLRVELSAHTDNVGNATANQKLSERRAQTVLNYLTDNGISADRLISKGYGMTKPLVPNNSDENRAKNRRVEFKVVE